MLKLLKMENLKVFGPDSIRNLLIDSFIDWVNSQEK